MTPIDTIMYRIIAQPSFCMKKILAFSGSFSEASINHELVKHVASLITTADVNVIRLADYNAPLYVKEIEKSSGVPEAVIELKKLFIEADGFIISTPEYNSSIPGGFKNTIDWLSRTEGSVFQNKPLLLMAASPGGRGGRSVLDHLATIVPFWGANLTGTFSLPRFQENFNNGVTDTQLRGMLEIELKKFEAALTQ